MPRLNSTPTTTHPRSPIPNDAPAPLGDLRTRHLVVALMRARTFGALKNADIGLPDRGATLLDIRSELRRREALGVGVR